MRKTDREAVLELPLFQGLDRGATEAVLARAEVECHDAGALLFKEGQPARHLHILISGMVELSRLEGERDCGVLIASTGDVFMPIAALFDEPYLTSARILSRSRILLLDPLAVRTAMARHPDLAMRMMQLVGGQWRLAVRHILDLKCRSGPQRLGSFLLRLADEHSGPGAAELPFSKRTLATRTGMTAETLSRALQTLAENGLHLRGTRIVVKDAPAIRRFCGPDPYPCGDEKRLGVNAL